MTSMAVLRATTLSVLIMFGCPSATPPGDPLITTENYCTNFVATLRAGYEQCCSMSEDEVNARLEFIEADCEAGEISSVRAGHSTLDSEIAQRCFDAYEQDFEDCIYDSALGAACRYRWYGFNGPGEDCRDVWYCERGLGCVGEFPDGTCTELPVEGESCGETAECAPGGLYCSYEDWTCHREPALGEACERDEICSAGSCVDGSCEPVPFCS